MLKYLVELYYHSNYVNPAYQDEETGGISEPKLANWLQVRLTPEGRSPRVFLEAHRMLQTKGYVNGLQERIRGFPEESIWLTDAGLERAEYQNPRFYGKALVQIRKHWPAVRIVGV